MLQVAPPVAIGGIALAVVAGPLLFAGAFGWSVSIIAGLSVAALLFATLAFAKGNETLLGWPFSALAGAVVWTGIQVAPLPCSWVRTLSPRSADEAEAAAGLLDEAARCAISVDPGATQRYLVAGTAIVALWLAGWLAASRGYRRQVYVAVAGAVLVLAGVTFLHLVLGMEQVYGVYRPVYARPSLLGPLLNENQLGGFLMFGVPILVVLGLEAERSEGRLLWFGGAVFVGALALMTLSRGAIGSLFGGLALLPVALLYQRKRRRRQGDQGGSRKSSLSRALPVVGAVFASAVALAAYVAGDQIRGQLGRDDTTKVGLIRDVLDFAITAPAVGYGRGALSAALVQHSGTLGRITHAENLPAQWIADWGLPFAAAMLFVLGRALLSAFRSERPLDIGVAVAIVALTVHNLVDFSLEMVGIAIVPAAAFGALLAPRRGHGIARSGSWRGLFSVGRVAPIVLIVCAVCAMYPGLRLEAGSAQALQDRLVERVEHQDQAGFAALLDVAVRLHPSEPAFALLAGHEARVRDGEQAIPWLNRAMTLAPGWAAPHSEAAHWLVAHGRSDQALLEIRAAAALDPASTEAIVCALLERGAPADDILRAAPAGAPREAFLAHAGTCLDAGAEATADIDMVVLLDYPDLIAPRMRAATRMLSAGNRDEAVDMMRAVVAVAPSDALVRRRLVEVMLGAGDVEGAIAAATEAAQMPLRRAERRALLAVLARAETRAGDTAAMRGTMGRLRSLSDGSPHYLSQVLLLSATYELQLGNRFDALRALEGAYDAAPQPSTLVRIAELAEATGNRPRALHAYTELCGLDPGHGLYCAEKVRLRSAP